MVIGTTGFTPEQKLDIEHAAKKMAIVFAPNMSVGVTLLINLVEQAAKILKEDFDIEVVEMHHKHKVDSPSGTALALTDKANKCLPKDSTPLSFASVRSGCIPGTHSLIFDSPVDTITLTHEARNREGFASGALHAAEWIKGKKGIYTMDDLIRTYL